MRLMRGPRAVFSKKDDGVYVATSHLKFSVFTSLINARNICVVVITRTQVRKRVACIMETLPADDAASGKLE